MIMTTEEILKALTEEIEENGWGVSVEEEEDYCIFTFENCSSMGQDICFEIEAENYNPELLIDNLYQYCENYDVSSETYLWLDSDGHGTNGAPYDMRDVYEDMSEVKEKIQDLYETLKEYYYSSGLCDKYEERFLEFKEDEE